MNRTREREDGVQVLAYLMLLQKTKITRSEDDMKEGGEVWMLAHLDPLHLLEDTTSPPLLLQLPPSTIPWEFSQSNFL